MRVCSLRRTAHPMDPHRALPSSEASQCAQITGGYLHGLATFGVIFGFNHHISDRFLHKKLPEEQQLLDQELP